MKTFQSTPITFIDQTDSRKLEVYIKSNLPTVQIFNGNSEAYTPDWTEGEKLVLSMDVFLDSRTMTTAEYNGTVIKWYKNDVEMSDGSIEDISDDKRKITIKDNILKDSPIITYTCEATYQGIVASTRITFTRLDSGLNGEAGADGTSVKILGTADSVAKVVNTNYYTLAYSDGAVVAAALGDSYVYNGDLYVCSVLNGDGNNDYFVNVGPIQGEPGKPARSIVLTGSSQVFKVDKDGKISPSTVTVTAHTVNLTTEQAQNIKWEYRYNASGVWTAIANGASTSDGIIALKDNVATINGSKLSASTMSVVLRATFDDAEDALTVYKTFDGADGEKGDSAPIAFLTNENISFVSEADGTTPNMQIITTRVVAYEGTEKVEPKLGSLTTTQAGLPTGMSIAVDTEATNLADKEIVLTITVQKGVNLGSALSNNGSISIPVVYPVSAPLSLNWSKINAGVGIQNIDVQYGTTNSSTVKPADDKWSDTIPEVPEGNYLWTRTIIDFTDPNKEDTVTYTYAKQGENGKKGETGTAGSSVTVKSIQYKEGTSATTPPTGTWSTAPVSVVDGNYLWTKTTFSDDKVAYGVAKQGSAGTDASLVDITPSSMYFKSTTGSTGTFTPQYIYLYPRFQNATYSNWQYSLDGGTVWKNVVSGSDWLLIDEFNSVPNTLRIERGSKLYTNDITSISFKCNSTDAGVYDTVSIAKIYDVVDLSIGARNLARLTDSEHWSHYPPGTGRTSAVTISDGSRGVRIKAQCNTTNESELATFGTQQVDDARVMKLKSGETYTLSFRARGNVSNLNYVYVMNSDGVANQGLGSITSSELSETVFTKYSKTFVAHDNVDLSTGSFVMISYRGPLDPSLWFEVEEVQIEAGNVATDWTPAPEDLLDAAANVNVMLSNEAHFFEATAGGVPIDTSVTLDVVGYKGSVRSETTVGSIIGIPSAGMTVTVANNGTTNTKLTIEITSALTSDIADYGILTIPITVNGHTINKIFNWTKAKEGDVGASGSDAVTFQVYSNNGYALSTSVPTLTLQTFAYVGDVEITAGATYQWYRNNDTDWVAVSGATNSYFNVSRDDVSFSNNYMCKMQFNSTEYVGVVTIDDKNDENKVFASKPSNYFAGDLWVVGTDYAPSGFDVGTMLRAEHTNSGYTDSDWVAATKYDDEIKDLKKTVDSYEQYFSIDSTNGLRVGDASINNDTLTVNRIETTTIEAKEVEVESPLTVTGRYSGSTMLQAPIINIGNFSIVVESNGSLSIVANT